MHLAPNSLYDGDYFREKKQLEDELTMYKRMAVQQRMDNAYQKRKITEIITLSDCHDCDVLVKCKLSKLNSICMFALFFSGRRASVVRKDETQQWKLVAGEMLDIVKGIKSEGNYGKELKSRYLLSMNS